jgi:FixJ family two-component response regulator
MARGIQIPVIFITAHADVPMAVRAIKAGAVEFLEKPFNGQMFLEKVQRALREDAERQARQIATKAIRSKFALLTGKEREVLTMIQEGRPNKEIATRLDITPRAVELRRASLMKKLGVGSLTELLRVAIDMEAEPLASRRRVL